MVDWHPMQTEYLFFINHVYMYAFTFKNACMFMFAWGRWNTWIGIQTRGKSDGNDEPRSIW